MAIDFSKLRIKKNVTLPTLSLKENQVAFVKFNEAIFVGKKVEPKPGSTEKQKEPPHLVNVTDLETGELKTLILNTVLKSTIDEAYPGGTYVGKSFRVEKMPKKAGKDYHGFMIQEIELDEPSTVAEVKPEPAKAAAIGGRR